MTYKLIGAAKSITPERAIRMIALIEEFGKRNLSINEVNAVASLSSSGSRKYIRDLLANGIVKEEGYSHGLRYVITDDKDRVKWFVMAIMAPSKDGLPRARGKKLEPEGLHVMADDEVFKVKRATWKLPVHTDLMSCFFGMNAA